MQPAYSEGGSALRDGLLGGRNCSCVWSFWCSELCSVDQTVTVQRGSVLDVRGPE